MTKRKKRADDEGIGTYVWHLATNKDGTPSKRGYWYRHYHSKVTKKIVCVREDPPSTNGHSDGMHQENTQGMHKDAQGEKTSENAPPEAETKNSKDQKTIMDYFKKKEK